MTIRASAESFYRGIAEILHSMAPLAEEMRRFAKQVRMSRLHRARRARRGRRW
jgi:hypothetical protein